MSEVGMPVQEGKYGIKDAVELFQFIETVIVGFSNIFADGKVGLLDLKEMPRMIRDGKEGIDGLKNAFREMGDLSDAELAFLLSKVDAIAAHTDGLRAAFEAIAERKASGKPPIGLFK